MIRLLLITEIQFHKDFGSDNVDGDNKLKNAQQIFDTHNSNVSAISKYKNLDESKNKNKSIQDIQMPAAPEMPYSGFQNDKQKQHLQYLTNSAIENCFATDESSTIVNIDIFDDQLSTSSNSNTSRFSCETTPLNTTTPPISLNGVINTNLMHFSPNSVAPLSTENTSRDSNFTSEENEICHDNRDNVIANTNNDNCDNDDVSSNVSGGSL